MTEHVGRGVLLVLGVIVAAGVTGAVSNAARVQAPSVVPVNGKVFNRSYADWNVAWARFEWSPSPKASPLLNPKPCRHEVVGKMFFLPGPAKGQTITCRIPAGLAVFVPTASGLGIRTDPKKDTSAALRAQATSVFAQTKVLAISIDGQTFDARRFANTTKFFTIDMTKDNALQLEPGRHVAIQSGYNFILRPLAAGVHTIKMHIKIAAAAKTLYEARTTFQLHVR